ncbi:MAG: hypothetical protein R8P61_17955 [Bacteroidia bacterium]|nr:hypothetical protein [Bacteroidia bacterium]
MKSLRIFALSILFYPDNALVQLIYKEIVHTNANVRLKEGPGSLDRGMVAIEKGAIA